MRVITNEDVIQNRRKWAQRVASMGLLCLVGGFALHFWSFTNAAMMNPALLMLSLGLLCSVVSARLVDKWVREPRGDQFLGTHLKKLDNRYQLFNYTVTTDHILLGPNGLFLIVSNPQDGKVRLKAKKYQKKFTFQRLLRFFSDEGSGYYNHEIDRTREKVQSMLKQELPDLDLPDVEPIIIFHNPESTLKVVEQPEMTVLAGKELRAHLRKFPEQEALTDEVRQQIAQVLKGEDA